MVAPRAAPRAGVVPERLRPRPRAARRGRPGDRPRRRADRRPLPGQRFRAALRAAAPGGPGRRGPRTLDRPNACSAQVPAPPRPVATTSSPSGETVQRGLPRVPRLALRRGTRRAHCAGLLRAARGPLPGARCLRPLRAAARASPTAPPPSRRCSTAPRTRMTYRRPTTPTGASAAAGTHRSARPASPVPAAPRRHPERLAVRLRRSSTSTAVGYCCAGANGAGKSKTLEMLLPFALDGDKLRMTASARHHTSACRG